MVVISAMPKRGWRLFYFLFITFFIIDYFFLGYFRFFWPFFLKKKKT